MLIIQGGAAVSLIPKAFYQVRKVHSKFYPKFGTDSSRFVGSHFDFIFFSFEVNIAVNRHVRLFLVLEEGIVEHLVVDVNFSEFWVHPLPQLLLDHFCTISVRERISQLGNTSSLNVTLLIRCINLE